MNIETSVDTTTAVISVSGEMDAHNAYDVFLAAAGEAEKGYSTIVLDLSGVTFIDSTGLGMLIRCRDELADHFEARTLLRSPSERVRSLLTVTALTGEFGYAD